MCGIAGVIASGRMPERTVTMLDEMLHRGPDGHQVSNANSFAIGTCRLRIRTSPEDPLLTTHCGGQIIAAFNGQVYGSYSTTGEYHRVQGGPAEVDEILSTSASENIDGMYAVALGRSNGVELRRDRFGIKPLFYAQMSQGHAFASELPALLKVTDAVTLNRESILEVLAFGRVLENRTCYREVARVPCGGRVIFACDGTMRVDTIDFRVSRVCTPTPATLNLRDVIRETISQTIETRHPLGLALSGGLDSTILATELSALGVTQCNTVSIVSELDGVPDLDSLCLDGTAWSSWTHTAVPIDEAHFRSSLAACTRRMGEPTRMSSVPLYDLLARAASGTGTRVLLLGEGADELFGGYESYRSFANGESHSTSVRNFVLPEARVSLLDLLLNDNDLAYIEQMASKLAHQNKGESPVATLRRNELELSLEPLLFRADRLLMEYAIEGRTPFLYGRIPALAAQIGNEQLFSQSVTKLPLRDAYQSTLKRAASIKKRPFRAPFFAWIKKAPQYWRSELQRALEVIRPLGIIYLHVDRLWRQAYDGDPEAVALIVPLLSLGDWATWLSSMGIDIGSVSDKCSVRI